jgi:riboflavin synthase
MNKNLHGRQIGNRTKIKVLFTGIIETLGEVTQLQNEGSNLHISIKSSISKDLKIDQSVAHNGVCLTVVNVREDTHTVTAIAETLQKSNIGSLKVNSLVNLERCMQMNGRLDGHIVQGHVDQTAICTNLEVEKGSWVFTFQYDSSLGNITVEKGSICVNGISLTVVNSGFNHFSVAIIPYTFENTNLKNIKPNDTVNLEFDIIGKYVAKMMANR